MYPVLLMHGSFLTKQCYSQITRDGTHMHRYTSIQQFFSQPSPLLPILALILPLLYILAPLFTYLENQLLLLVMQNTRTLLSLVCYQLLSPCCFTHPKAPHRSSNIFTQTSATSAVPSDTVLHKILLHVH